MKVWSNIIKLMGKSSIVKFYKTNHGDVKFEDEKYFDCNFNKKENI